MHRVYKLTTTFCETFPYLSKRSFSLTNPAFTWNPVRHAQNLDLGRQAFRVYAVQTLIDRYPDLTAHEVDDVANGLTFENDISSRIKHSTLLKSGKGVNDILAKIGEHKRKNNDSAVTEIFKEVENTCLSSLSSEDTVSLIKSQHPKFLLRHFCDLANIEVHSTSERQKDGAYLTSIFFGENHICTENHPEKHKAMHIACLSAIRSEFKEQFDVIQLKDFDEIPLERDVDMGDKPRQRVVNVIKSADEDFGFTIRGGQQKVIRNKDFIQLNIITPITIYSVKEGSPAESCGLRTGDIMIGINDENLTNKTHEQAARSVKRCSQHETVSFTVLYNKQELLKYEAEQRILERKLTRVKDEVQSKKFRKWHESKSKEDPIEYFMEEFVEKKKMFLHKKGGNKNRLWHQYKPPKRR